MVERQRQTVDSAYADPWKPEKEGEVLEGFYLGFTKVPSPRKEQGPFKSYNVKTEGGEYRGISGAIVGSKLQRVPKGTYIWVTYKGKIKTNQGMAKDFDVECEAGTKLLDPVTSMDHDDSDIDF